MIRKRPRALLAIHEQAIYLLDNASIEVAERFLDSVERTLADIELRPRMGRRWDDPDPRLAGLRWRKVSGFPNHLLFYRGIEGGIEVVHLLHARQDRAGRLSREVPE